MNSLKNRFPLYSRLVKLYPASYQKDYGEQMLQTLADMLDGAVTAGERRSIWGRTVRDLPLSIARQQIITTGGIMAHETPDYVKRSGLTGGILLLPFFLALITNGLNKLIYNQDLYHSWLWSATAVFTWAILLPVIALIISAAAFLYWAAGRRQSGKTTSRELVVDWHHNWPILGVLVVSLAIIAMIFGHDSVHCATGNPIKEVRNLHATWQCIKNN